MPYYEFFNLPSVPGWPAAPSSRTTEGNRESSPGAFSETGIPDDLWITYSLSAETDQYGWAKSGPDYGCFSISRRVRTHSNRSGDLSKNIEVGDLMLFRLTLMSTMADWHTDKPEDGQTRNPKWPKAHIEMGTQSGVRLKLDLERIVVDRWTLDVEDDDAAEIFETLYFRAWVIEHSLAQGGTIAMELKESGDG